MPKGKQGIDDDDDLLSPSQVRPESHLDTCLTADICTCLGSIGCVTVHDVSLKSDDDLTAIRNFGPKSLVIVRQLVQRAQSNAEDDQRFQQEHARDQLLGEIAQLRRMAAESKKKDIARPQT